MHRADRSDTTGTAKGNRRSHHGDTDRTDQVVTLRIALLGNPNTGKSTLFNRLCGLRSKTANHPGSTVEHQVGRCTTAAGEVCDLIDLPGIYSLMLEMPESKLCVDCLEGRIGDGRPDGALIVLDANNLLRNLQFAASALRRGLPSVIAINMVDLAKRRGLIIDEAAATAWLGVPVIAVSARTGAGVERLLEAIANASRAPSQATPILSLPSSEPGSAASSAWAAEVFARIAAHPPLPLDHEMSVHDRLDAAFTHPVLGIVVFALAMSLLFASIYWLAAFPMDAVDSIFGWVGAVVTSLFPSGILRDLAVDGVVGGVAATVVFLPQIVLLFFLLALLEDSGYLARAAFAVDRVMRRFGLPGQAFMPLLSSHACALPGIMATRLIPDARERLTTILVAPFMSCSARVPVYALLTGLLFAGRPIAAGIAFTACYVLGAVAALATAAILRNSILRGPSAPMMLELPDYRLPSLRTAAFVAIDRGFVFLKSAGSVILAIAVVMWWLSAYPKVAPSSESSTLRARAEMIETTAPAQATALIANADRLDERTQQAGSFAGQLGAICQPAFAPIGLDQQLTVAVFTSFLAREVFTTTVFVLAGAGHSADGEELGTLDTVRRATRTDGQALFNIPTAASLLVFFVLAMQCLPTLVVVRRETGSWRWPLAQFVYMSGVAYGAAWLTYRWMS
ncbi:MAG: ferrous iron transporter B [Phycisphaerales bacterium]|nr:ferrous iron transporter B [Phycisphaerales bacterium]